jgi:GAF domain-containing protein/uncharacterized protein YjeT (DUF2065 family)
MSDLSGAFAKRPFIRALHRSFERLGARYFYIATSLALILAAPLALASMSTVVFRTNLSQGQLRLFGLTLLVTSAVSTLIVYGYITFLTPAIRRTLRQADVSPSQYQQAWAEAIALPVNMLFAIGFTLVLTYILPMWAVTQFFGGFSVDESIYILLGQVLAGLNLLVSANLLMRLALMPVYNFLASKQESLEVAELPTISMRPILVFQSMAIVSLALLTLAPRDYFEITHLMARAGFQVVNLPQIRQNMIVITMVSLGMSFFYSVFLSYITGIPLTLITDAIQKNQESPETFLTPVLTGDESGRVAMYLNNLLLQNRRIRENLEQEVQKQTAVLEKQARELRAITAITQQTANFETLSELFDALVQLIHEYFGFYHVGIFLLDEKNLTVVLRASNSAGGKRMLARGHKLRLGEGIVGTAAQQRQARIALDVGADAVFFNNPDLPETRSEMALPLLVRGQVIGVLDIQSSQVNAFSAEDIETLQTLANQVALAIDNIRLRESSRATIQELQTLLQENIRRSWQNRLARENLKFTYTGLGVIPGESTGSKSGGYALEIPIAFQDVQLGSLRLKRLDRPWTRREKEVAAEISQQISLALESARLLEQTQKYVAREQTISAISNRIRQSLDMDAILRTAVNELQWRLELSEAEVQIIPAQKNAQEQG